MSAALENSLTVGWKFCKVALCTLVGQSSAFANVSFWVMVYEIGMYDIGFFADIRYANISNSLWSIPIYVHIFFQLAETIMHASIDCTKYDQERQYMKEELSKTGVQELSIETLMNLPSG